MSSKAMYGRAVRFAINSRNYVESSTVGFRVHPAFFLSTQPNYKKRNLVDDIRESASGMPPTPPSTTTPSSSTLTCFDRNSGRDTVKQGVVEAVDTGLDIGEMAKNTLDNIYDVTKDATHKLKEAVAGDEKV